MTVCIVANGCVKCKGSLIDNHKTVIRMHHSPIEHLKDVVGDKMDVWVCPRGFIREWMNIPKMNPKEVWSFNQEQKNEALLQQYPHFNGKLVVASKEFMQKVYKKVPRHPTKGLLTVFFALDHYPPPIYLTGFSFYETPEAFFWNMREKAPPTENDPKIEKRILLEMQEEGLVKFL